MNKDNELDERIQKKEEELARRVAALDSYAATCGRDRWWNRGRHDVTTLQAELNELLALRGASEPSNHTE